MPMYEYECARCHTIFEVLQRFSDDPLKKHQGCGGKVKRLLSAPSFHFKGSGFYITDYAKEGAKGGESKAETSSTVESKASEAKVTDSKTTDTKPAADSSPAKTETKPATAKEKAKTSSSKKRSKA